MQGPVCSVCGSEFEVRFTYQTEEVVDTDSTGRDRARSAFFCSQSCLEESLAANDDGATCDSCGVVFHVELASQVLFTGGGRRRYACSPGCRQEVLAEARGGAVDAIPPVLDPSLRTMPPSGIGSADSDVPRTLAVFNHKGGTGKTTTAVSIAAGLATRGARVLLVDTDAQGNVAHSLGIRVERSLYHVLVMGLPLTHAITRLRDGLDVLPSNETLAAAELYLAGRKHRDRVLATRLAMAPELYDFVVLDCSPSLSLLNQNALAMSDAVLCPVACDYLSLVGVRQVQRTIQQVNTLLRHPVKLWGVLPTMFDPRARICHEALTTLREHFRDRCFDPVRMATRLKEAPSQSRTIFEWAPDSGAARDYLRVVGRLLGDTDRGARPSKRAQPA